MARYVDTEQNYWTYTTTKLDTETLTKTIIVFTSGCTENTKTQFLSCEEMKNEVQTEYDRLLKEFYCKVKNLQEIYDEKLKTLKQLEKELNRK